jgi:hypothetical protein
MSIDITVNETIESVDITANLNVIEVNITRQSGGGGNQNLQEVTNVGNTTSNDVQLLTDANIILGSGGGVLLDNGSKLKEGTIDASFGGSKGIAQICAVGYELKWEAGRLYVMNDGGTTIREVSYNFSTSPSANDDITKGFIIGSRWVLDNGNLYICTDSTEANAVWELQATQVNSDWNATSGVAEILNKPTIPAAQVNSDWNATSGLAEILNKPTIPVVTGFIPYTGATQNVDLGEYQIKAGQFELDQTPTGTAGVAITRWNNTLGSTETTLKGGNVVLKNGVDLVARVVNKVTPNTTLTKAAYQAVRVTGAQGQRLAVAFAQANNDNNSADTIGLVCETIATNQEGFILTVGQLEEINTTGALQGETWNDGDVLYLSPTTAGRLTNVKPTGATGHIVVIGYVEYSHAIHGKIYVKIMNGWQLDELHNVNISSPTNNQILAYTSASSLWENKTLKTIEGLSLIGTTDLGYYNNLSFEQNFGYMVPTVGATTYSSIRATTNVIQVGVSADFTNVTPRMLYASITTAGNFAIQRGTAGGAFTFATTLKMYWKRRFQIDSNISGSRFVCGLSNAFQLSAPTNVEPDTLINTIGVCKLSTSNNLHFFWNDATGLATTVDLGVNYPANNVTAYTYDLEIYKELGTANITLKLTRIDASGNRISTTQVISTNYNNAVSHSAIIYATNNATTGSVRFFDYGTIFKNYNLQWDTI